MGIDAAVAYRDTVVPLEPGDVLLLYTDGVIEASDGAGNLYGLERLCELLRAAGVRPAGELVAGLREALVGHCGSATLEDDMTVLAVALDRSG